MDFPGGNGGRARGTKRRTEEPGTGNEPGNRGVNQGSTKALKKGVHQGTEEGSAEQYLSSFHSHPEVDPRRHRDALVFVAVRD